MRTSSSGACASTFTPTATGLGASTNYLQREKLSEDLVIGCVCQQVCCRVQLMPLGGDVAVRTACAHGLTERRTNGRITPVTSWAPLHSSGNSNSIDVRRGGGQAVADSSTGVGAGAVAEVRVTHV